MYTETGHLVLLLLSVPVVVGGDHEGMFRRRKPCFMHLGTRKIHESLP